MNDSSNFSAPLSYLWQEKRPPSEAAAVLAGERQTGHVSQGAIAALPRAPRTHPAQPCRLPLLLPSSHTSWPLPDPPHSFLLLAESILSLISFPQCRLLRLFLFHPSAAICPRHFGHSPVTQDLRSCSHASGHVGGMPCGGCPTRTALSGILSLVKAAQLSDSVLQPAINSLWTRPLLPLPLRPFLLVSSDAPKLRQCQPSHLPPTTSAASAFFLAARGNIS